MSAGNVLSRQNESLLRALSTRHGRKNSEFCLIEGLRCGKEVLLLHPELVEKVILREGTLFPEAPDEKTIILPPEKFDQTSGTVNSQGILILSKKIPYLPADAPLRDPFALILDRIADPGNFGTIIRTARAAGLHEIWIVKGTVDPFSEKALRSASSAQFAVSIRCAETLDDAAQSLRKLGIRRFYRTEPAGGGNIFKEPDLFTSSAVILGNEANGAAPLEGSLALNIPMPGSAESLNVAQAATVVLFEYVRRMG